MLYMTHWQFDSNSCQWLEMPDYPTSCPISIIYHRHHREYYYTFSICCRNQEQTKTNTTTIQTFKTLSEDDKAIDGSLISDQFPLDKRKLYTVSIKTIAKETIAWKLHDSFKKQYPFFKQQEVKVVVLRPAVEYLWLYRKK